MPRNFTNGCWNSKSETFSLCFITLNYAIPMHANNDVCLCSLRLFHDTFDLPMKPKSIDSPGSLLYMKKFDEYQNVQLQIYKYFNHAVNFVRWGRTISTQITNLLCDIWKWYSCLTCPAISLICRFVMHTLVILLIMEILDMESLEDDPVMSPATGEKAECTAFLRQTAGRFWWEPGDVNLSQRLVDQLVQPQFPPDYNRKMLKIPCAYCICKSGMTLWNRDPVLINRHGKVSILISIEVCLVFFFSRVSCTEYIYIYLNRAIIDSDPTIWHALYLEYTVSERSFEEEEGMIGWSNPVCGNSLYFHIKCVGMCSQPHNETNYWWSEQCQATKNSPFCVCATHIPGKDMVSCKADSDGSGCVGERVFHLECLGLKNIHGK